ncbi:MAG: NapC/NirT family cytochrome c [Acidobacteriia bacterium]|nr:NapC/NirT family cytochrome c [Terriglobia bacterium]
MREDLAQVLRPLVYLSGNLLSRVGVVVTTSSAVTLVVVYVSAFFGSFRPNPYVGILVFLILPGVFVLGLVLIPVGIIREFRRRRRLGALPSIYPTIDFSQRELRRTALFIAVMTAINVPLFAVASYRGTVYMDSVQFCGLTCHQVMAPEFTAYQRSPHARVACVDCHIGPGAPWFVRSKLSGSYQVLAVTFNLYPRPIPTPVHNLRPASETCEECHWPERFSGDKLVIRSKYADDEHNTASKTVLLMHIGGRNLDLTLVGIHGAHLGLVTYISTDEKRQQIPWVSHREPDGTIAEYASTENPPKPELLASGVRRLMDCMDCHNRPSHIFYLPETAVDREMAAGRISASLPFVHKVSVELLKKNYPTRQDAETDLPEALGEYYRKNHLSVYNSQQAEIEQAGRALVYIYEGNVFPAMNVTWGTYPNNLGHMDFPGCFRCHDGNHKTKGGKEITQDCNACHNLLAMDEADPKILHELAGGN